MIKRKHHTSIVRVEFCPPVEWYRDGKTWTTLDNRGVVWPEPYWSAVDGVEYGYRWSYSYPSASRSEGYSLTAWSACVTVCRIMAREGEIKAGRRTRG
jgi:hypothetical protein